MYLKYYIIININIINNHSSNNNGIGVLHKLILKSNTFG